jgi:type VI protein secretion system component Hcp
VELFEGKHWKRFQESPPVRFKNLTYHAPGKGDLKIEFTKQQLSSYSGLELFRHYFQLIGLHFRIRRSFRAHQLSGDYSILDCILVFFALWLTGGKRLRLTSYIADDPLLKRLCGLSRFPCDRTLSRFLGQFTLESLQALVDLNSELVTEQIRKLGLPRVTLDFDGTVLTTGKKVKWAFRGYNPHKRNAPSYYPLLCHVAQTGHFLTVKNRPGNVHDSKGLVQGERGRGRAKDSESMTETSIDRFQMQDISMTKFQDFTSTQLMKVSSKLTQLKNAKLTITNSNGSSVFEFENVRVSSLSLGGSGGEDRMTENVTLSFTGIKYKMTIKADDKEVTSPVFEYSEK